MVLVGKECPSGDNEKRQRAFIRYVYDRDNDGIPIHDDCDDNNPLVLYRL